MYFLHLIEGITLRELAAKSPLAIVEYAEAVLLAGVYNSLRELFPPEPDGKGGYKDWASVYGRGIVENAVDTLNGWDINSNRIVFQALKSREIVGVCGNGYDFMHEPLTMPNAPQPLNPGADK